MYNENVLKWCGPYDTEEYDDLIVYDEEIVVVDDSGEWYNNIYGSEADDWVAVVWGSVTVALEILVLFVWVRILAPESYILW